MEASRGATVRSPLGGIDPEERTRERFRYFARLRIRGAMIDGLRETDSAPRRLRRSARHLRHCVYRLEQALARAPSGREIAEEMQLTLAQYHRLVQERDAHKPVDLTPPLIQLQAIERSINCIHGNLRFRCM
jgi:DNA-directed RNA polymerase specialized sigma subunit